MCTADFCELRAKQLTEILLLQTLYKLSVTDFCDSQQTHTAPESKILKTSSNTTNTCNTDMFREHLPSSGSALVPSLPRTDLHLLHGTIRDNTTFNFRTSLKGTVHPKMNSLSSFTHPNLYECVCSEHKGRYSEERGKQSSIFLLLWKSMMPQNSLITNFLQNIFLCVQNKHIHTDLDLLEDE